MKKVFIPIILFMCCFLTGTLCHAADRQCPLIWDNVAGHTFTLTIGEQSYEVKFSDSYAGPCPIGTVEVYDGIYIAPRLMCSYRSGSNSSVILELGDDVELPLYWWKGKLTQIVIPENAIVLEPKKDE